MTRAQRTILGITSFVPIFCLILWCVSLMAGLSMIVGYYRAHEAEKDGLEGLLDFGRTLLMVATFVYEAAVAGAVLAIPVLLIIIFLAIFYIKHACDNKRGRERMIWVVMLLLINVLAFPIYWWFQIKTKSAPRKQVQLPI